MRKQIFLAALIFISWQVHSQERLSLSPQVSRAIAKKTRTETGEPGPAYWQNTAAYKLKVSFIPSTRAVSGTVGVTYRNNSPDTLSQVVFKLYPNLYKRGTEKQVPIKSSDLTDGVKIAQFDINGQNAAAPVIDGTNMIAKIPRLLPGKSMDFSITYSFVLNKDSHERGGEVDKGAYFLAYFFPRIAVYDDIDGWNLYPYRGSEEFYNDFCDFDAEISLPEKQVAWATGDLGNAEEVFTPGIIKKMRAAGTGDAVVDVIDSADLARRIVLKPGPHTWKFKATHVTDFVFAISDHYIWKSTSLVVDTVTGRRTRVDAVFNPAHKDYYEVIDFARKTIETMSYSFPRWPFPYAHETVFDGLAQMEYPMMVNDNPTPTREDGITLTDHEIFHTMFPFYMGINETKYGWMDEGWATMAEWLISKVIEPGYTDTYGVALYEKSAGSSSDAPIMTLTTDLEGAGSFTNTYPKPAMGYLYVKDLLGDELFTRALHHYISLWNGKHPVPSDFFNAMNAGSGKNLDWFWKRWFFDKGVPDLAIGNVSAESGVYQVTILEKGGKPMPVDLTITYSDESTELIHRSVALWENNEKAAVVGFTAAGPVKNIRLGSTYVPDKDKSNNNWTPAK